MSSNSSCARRYDLLYYIATPVAGRQQCNVPSLSSARTHEHALIYSLLQRNNLTPPRSVAYKIAYIGGRAEDWWAAGPLVRAKHFSGNRHILRVAAIR